MNVDAAQPRDRQHRLGQQQTVGNHDHQVRPQGRELLLFPLRSQGSRLIDCQIVLQREQLDR